MLKTFVSQLKLLQNHFLRSFLWPNFDLNSFECFVSLSQKMVSNSSFKNQQKTEKCSFQTFWTFVFDLKVPPKPFSSSWWPNFYLNSFERIASLSQKMVSTSSLKNLQKTEKCTFQKLRTIAFEVKVASKPFSKKFTMAKIWFKKYSTLSLTFPEIVSTSSLKILQKTWKMLFSNVQNIRFWTQGSTKTIF